MERTQSKNRQVRDTSLADHPVMTRRGNTPTATRSGPSVKAAGMPRSRYRSLADPDSLREFAKNLGEGIYITTPDGRILDANPAFLQLFGVRSLADFDGMS